MAHSAGGLYVREYFRQFPADAAAVALIDASSPQQIDELPGFRAAYELDKRDAKRDLRKDRLRVSSGLERLLGHCSVSPTDFPGWAGQDNAMAYRPDYVGTDESELNYFEESCRQAGRLATFGNVPLLVITRDLDFRKGLTPRALSYIPVWAREQEASKSLSTWSWRVIARESGHMVPLDRPDLIVSEVTHLVEYLRGSAAPPFASTEVG